ncbi:MAG: DMT family transporter [Actinobacteria bacterium]|nr:DMT family transporter [Actinomycetota bacterium]
MTTRVSDRLVWAVVLLITFGWGTLPVLIRVALREDLRPLVIAAAPSIVAAVALALFLVATRRLHSIGSTEVRIGLALAALSVVLPNLLRPLAAEHASAGFLGLTSALVPLTTVLLAHFVLADERLKAATAGGLLLGLAGVATLVLSGDSGLGAKGNVVLAAAYAMGSVLSVSLSAVFAKRFAGRYSVMGVSWVQFAAGAAVLTAAALVWEGVPPNPTLLGWGSLVFLGLLCTFMPVVLFYWLLQHVTVTYSTIIGYLIPLVSVVVGWLFLDETVGWGILLGGILILGGVVVTDLIRVRDARRERAAAGRTL